MKTEATIAAQKIKMMKRSLSCLTLGLLGLLPFIGVLFVLPALLESFQARKMERYYWNPAKPQRVTGLTCAALGGLIWSLADTFLIYQIANNTSG